jgi:hypothetical protein
VVRLHSTHVIIFIFFAAFCNRFFSHSHTHTHTHTNTYSYSHSNSAAYSHTPRYSSTHGTPNATSAPVRRRRLTQTPYHNRTVAGVADPGREARSPARETRATQNYCANDFLAVSKS